MQDLTKITKIKLRRANNLKIWLQAAIIGFVLFSAIAWWLELGISYIQKEVCLGSQGAAVSISQDLNFEINEHDKTRSALYSAEYELFNN